MSNHSELPKNSALLWIHQLKKPQHVCEWNKVLLACLLLASCYVCCFYHLPMLGNFWFNCPSMVNTSSPCQRHGRAWISRVYLQFRLPSRVSSLSLALTISHVSSSHLSHLTLSLPRTSDPHESWNSFLLTSIQQWFPIVLWQAHLCL